MAVRKSKVESTSYLVGTLLTMTGLGLCLAGLLLPNWYIHSFVVGIVETEIKVGLWQDEVCVGNKGCKTYWVHEDGYTRIDDMIPSGELIQGFVTAGAALGAFALVSLIPLWCTYCMQSTKFFRLFSYMLFFVSSMLAGLLSVVGVLILASKGNESKTEWAPFLTGVGGALFLISGCLACVICRYDPSYGTLENPVSPTFIRN